MATTQVDSKEAMEVAEEAREKEWRQPSFAGQMFLGTYDLSLLYPFPKQSEEDKRIGDEFIAKLTTFLQENLDPEKVDATKEIPKHVIEGMGKLGVFAMKVPKEYGGLGFSQVNYNRVVHKVASYCGGTAVLISAHQSIGVPQPLRLYGTEEQKKKFFPRFREGAISAFALTEPDVGSDPARMSSEAVLSEDGSHYVLNGTKLWCTNGVLADVIIVVARTAPKIVKGKEKKRITAFILEMDTPGVEITHRCEFMGLGGIYNAQIEFNNVKIPKENLLWKEGRGLAMALATINVGRLTLPAACSGTAKMCLKVARKWGKERVQWGQPVGLHEAGREKISYIAATTFAMDALTWLTSHWADQLKNDIRIEAAMAKMFCTEEMWTITDMTMQLRGGRGYEKASSLRARGEPGYPIERAMRDCRINMILEGSTEIMKLFLAREAMDPHFKRLMQFIKGDMTTGRKIVQGFKTLGHYAVWYSSQFIKSLFTNSHKEFGEMAPYIRFCEKTSHKLARSIFYYMARYQQKLEYKQMILGRLMEIGTDLFVISAVCSYAVSKPQEERESALALANHFCKLAKRRIEERFKSLTDNDDKSANRLAKKVIDAEMAWMEDNIFPIDE